VVSLLKNQPTSPDGLLAAKLTYVTGRSSYYNINPYHLTVAAMNKKG
jgi:hypothetical protein